MRRWQSPDPCLSILEFLEVNFPSQERSLGASTASRSRERALLWGEACSHPLYKGWEEACILLGL